jgi:hypothetical protein
VFEIPELSHDAWVLHHKNSPAHDVFVTPEFLFKTSVTIMNHPPYLPDLDQHIFWLFQKLTTILKGQYLSVVASIKRHAMTLLNSIPEEGFQQCFEQLKMLTHQPCCCVRRLL